MFKKLVVIVIIIVAVFILFGLVKQIQSALGSDERLNKLLEDVSGLESQNKQLKKELAQSETLDSVEEVARNNLNMSLPNETVVIVPEDLIKKILMPPIKYVEPKAPNWQGWANLFIHER